MLGSCCRSWTPGTVRLGGSYRMLHGSDVVARWMQVVVVCCVEVVGGVMGMVVALKKPRHNNVTLASCSTHT